VGVNLLLHGPVGTGSVEITRFQAGPAIIQAMTAGNALGTTLGDTWATFPLFAT
jgi:hypothetical protein